MEWLMQNLGTIIVAALVIAVLGFVSYRMARDKRAGKSSCGSGCAGCALQGKCHPQKEEDKQP